jgi:chromosome segregation ATPase
LGERFTERL